MIDSFNTDAELLAAFRRMHPTYTAKKLESVLCVKRRLSFYLLKKQKLEDSQRRLLTIYLNLSPKDRERFFT